jgi:cytochrome c6
MKQWIRKQRRHKTSAHVMGLFFAVIVAVIPAGAQENSSGASVYKSKCVTCHGQDGGGTAMGKTLQVADLRSPAVQSKSDAELIQFVSDGKNNMPGFKGDLTDAEIHAVVTFVRTLAAKGDAKKK